MIVAAGAAAAGPRYLVRLFQLEDAEGRPAPAQSVREVPVMTMRIMAESAIRVIGDLELSPTVESGSYLYRDPAGGAGWLRLEGFRRSDLEVADDLVRTFEISRSIGRSDPHRPEDLGSIAYLTPRTTNPFVQIGMGAVALIMGAVGLVVVLVGGIHGGAGAAIAAGITCAGLVGVGIWALVIGGRRVPWWRAARAEAKRRGGSPPDQLKIVN